VRCPWDDDTRPGPLVERCVVRAVRYFTGGDVLWPYCSVQLVKRSSEDAAAGTHFNSQHHSEPRSAEIDANEHSAKDSDSVQSHTQESISTQVQQGIVMVKHEGDNGVQRGSGDETNKAQLAIEVREQEKNNEGFIDRGFYVTLHGGNELPEFVIDERMFDDCMVCMNVCMYYECMYLYVFSFVCLCMCV
jgi:hypothetical protein